MRAQRRPRALPSRQDRRPVRRRHDGAAPPRRARSASPGACSGERLGEAFQVADDIRDVAASAEELGKPVGQDEALGRQSAVRELGLDGAVRRLDRLMADAVGSIPACPGCGRAAHPDPALMAGISCPKAWCAWRPETVLHAASPIRRRRTACASSLSARWHDRWLTVRDRLLASAALPALGRRVPADPPDRAAARARPVRPVRRVRLRAGPAGLRQAAAVRPPGRGPADRWPPWRRASAWRPTPPSGCWRLRPRSTWLRAAAAAASGSGRWGRRWSDNPGVAAMIEHHALLYADLADPVALLRGEAGETELCATGPMPRPPGQAIWSPTRSPRYSALMAASQPHGRRRDPGGLPAGGASLPARCRRRRGRVPGRGGGAARRTCA